MPRRQLDALRRHQVGEGIVRRRYGLVHGGDDALVLLRTGDGQHVREALLDLLGLGPHAAGDDHPAVLRHGRADRVERFSLGAVEEAAGVDDDDVGAVMPARDLVALRPQMGEDALGVDQRLGAAEADEGDDGGGLAHAGDRRALFPLAEGNAGLGLVDLRRFDDLHGHRFRRGCRNSSPPRR